MDSSFFIALFNCFVTILIIVDPFLSLAVFVSLIKGMSPENVRKQAFVATSVAFGVMIVFLFAGMAMLAVLGVTLSSFQVGGGLVLLLLAVQTVLGIEFGNKKQKRG